MENKKISLLEFDSNPNIGLYLFVNDKFCLLGKEVSEEKKKEIENILNVPVYNLTIIGSDLVGVFVAGNNDFILIPKAHDYELKKIEEICAKHEVILHVVDEKLNTFGNNFCVGNDKIIINPNYDTKFKNKLAKKTNYEIIKLKNKEFESAGSVCKFLNGKFFISQEISENDVKKFSSDVCGVGTINAGSNMISSGVVGNSYGLLLGSMSTTIEISNITQSFDYL